MTPTHRLACSLLFACLSLPALAAPQHALTLYDEPPKYPADFKHFDYVNPDAPKGGTFASPASVVSTASTRSSTRACRPTTSTSSTTP
jgi:ABC-type oligopeptide transport system substrate-binding subunit